MNTGELSQHVFVLKLSDQPGVMELVAATFAHRGVSFSTTLGNGGTLDPEGRATILVTFSATPAKKEILRRALDRLPRVRSLVEHSMESQALRKTAVMRLRGAAEPEVAEGARVEPIGEDAAAGAATFLLVGSPAAVDATLAGLKASGRLLEVIAAVIGL